MTDDAAKIIRHKQVREAAEEMDSWLDSETKEYVELVFRMLASLPGGERLEDLGYEAYDFLGWKEVDLLATLLNAIQGKQDVEEVVDYLLREMDEEDED